MQTKVHADDAERISRVIFQYGGRIWSEKDKGAQLATIAEMTRDLVGADRCSIWLKDRETNELYTRVAQGLGLGEVRVPGGQGLVGSCVECGTPSVVNNAAEDARFSGSVDLKSGYQTHSILTVPMRGASGEVIGACQVLNKPGGFIPSDVDLVCLSASFSAEAIENQELQRVRESARHMQIELEIARNVQLNMLPRSAPVHPGVECAGLCRPALEVGGDYYYFWSLPTGNFGIALGDVSGKGISASLLMASVQASLHGLLRYRPASANAMIGDLNQVVFDTSPAERYSTLFFAEYNPGEHTLTYVNAGQVAPILYRERAEAHEKYTRLETGGPPVGLFSGAEYEEQTVRFHEGDCLICFSDGISESMNDKNEEWGEENIIGELANMPQMSAGPLAGHLIHAAERFASGAPQHDDMTVAVLRVVDVKHDHCAFFPSPKKD